MYLKSLLEINEEYILLLENQNYSKNYSVRSFFTDKKFLGSRDRKILANVTYPFLRNKLLLDYLHSHFNLKISKSELLCLLAIYMYDIFPQFRSINSILLNIINAESLSKADAIDKEYLQSLIINLKSFSVDDSIPFDARYSIPEVFFRNMPEQYRSFEMLSRFLEEPSVYIRINSNIAHASKVESFIKFSTFEMKRSRIVDNSYSLIERSDIENNKYYQSAIYEIQDIGSNIICNAVNRNSKTVLDACAGAGGKSIGILNNIPTASIFSYDKSSTRLDALRSRLNRYNSIKKHIHISNTLSPSMKYDSVLVDAPCSGSGTVRRDPRIKFALSDAAIRNYAEAQYNILTEYSQYVKPFGELIYSTCSIFTAENTSVVEKFLSDNKDFTLVPASRLLEELEINQNVISDPFGVWLNPLEHDSDGFFIAKMIRKA